MNLRGAAATASCAGLALLIFGFAYDLAYAGIPPQDPTPSMRANYVRASNIASALEIVGAVSFLVGTVVFLASYGRKTKEPNKSPETNALPGQ